MAEPIETSEASAMWDEFAAPLRAFVARRVPPGIDPDDVVQEVFVRVVRHLPALRSRDRIAAWLFQITRNTLLDAFRARRRRDGHNESLDDDVADERNTEDARAAEAELAPCLAGMITRLPEPYRGAIELTSIQGLSQTDAARRAGVSVSGMKSRVQRARLQLKQMLLGCCQVRIDSRGGVTDYNLRKSASCDGSASATNATRACAPGGCTPRQ